MTNMIRTCRIMVINLISGYIVESRAAGIDITCVERHLLSGRAKMNEVELL